GILQQSALARLPGRTRIAAIGQCDDPGPVGDDATKAVEEAGEIIAIAMEVEHDRTARLGRNVPDDELLAVSRRQDMLFGFRKARRLWRRAHTGRGRKQNRALREEQCEQTTDITSRNDDQEPF